MGSTVIDGPRGKTCRYELESVVRSRVSGTVIRNPKNTYVATCTSKMGDAMTPLVCATAINDWKPR